MVNSTYFDLFFKSSIPKQVSISFDGVVLTNDDLYNQEMELEENLCSEGELRFGSCEASILKFKSSDWKGAPMRPFLSEGTRWIPTVFPMTGSTVR